MNSSIVWADVLPVAGPKIFANYLFTLLISIVVMTTYYMIWPCYKYLVCNDVFVDGSEEEDEEGEKKRGRDEKYEIQINVEGRSRVVKYITMGLENEKKKGWWSLSLLGS